MADVTQAQTIYPLAAAASSQGGASTPTTTTLTASTGAPPGAAWIKNLLLILMTVLFGGLAVLVNIAFFIAGNKDAGPMMELVNGAILVSFPAHLLSLLFGLGKATAGSSDG